MLDKFFEGTFSLDLSSGHVRLEQLVVKPGALPAHMPIALEYGRIGSLHIEVPLLRLLSRPIRVVVERVVLKLRLQSDPISDDEALALAAVERLTAVVDALQEQAAKPTVERAKVRGHQHPHPHPMVKSLATCHRLEAASGAVCSSGLRHVSSRMWR